METEQLALMGMVGHWVSAVLQTAGLYAQGHMLDAYGHFIFTVGGLIFTFAVLAAIVTVALHGNYGQLLYFIVAPGLFLFMLTVTVDVCSVRYQFGFATIDNSCEDLKKPLMSIAPDYYEGTAKVSWFFANFDKLVSYIVQKTVSVITPTANHEHIVKLARERLILKLARARISDPAFQELLSIAMLGECSASFSRAMDMATIGPDDSQLSEIAKSVGFDPVVNKDRMEKALSEYKVLREQPIWLDQPLKDLLSQQKFEPFLSATNININEPLTCHQIWQTVIYGSYLGAQSFFTSTKEDQRIYPAIFPDGDTTQWDEEVVRDVKEKLFDSPFLSGAPVFIPGVADDDDARSAMILAGFYLRNALSYNSLGGMTVRNRRYEMYNEPAYRFDFATVAQHDAAANALDLVHFAAYVPYAEGILLYFLTATFPFFALFLLIPGRQGSFAIWMSLWAWVKSWDIGFAMVHVLRDVIWHITPSFSAENTLYNLNVLDFDNPATILTMVFQNDPISNLNTYFFIVSMFTIGVPAVSAQMFAGAAQVYGAISKGQGNGLRPQSKLFDSKATSTTNSRGGDAIDGKANTFGTKGDGNQQSLNRGNSPQNTSPFTSDRDASGSPNQDPSDSQLPSRSPQADSGDYGRSPKGLRTGDQRPQQSRPSSPTNDLPTHTPDNEEAEGI